MDKKNAERTLALAGLFQASYLVQQIARTGSADSGSFEHSIQSVLVTDAPSTDQVYGGVDGVRQGLEVLSTLLTAQNKERDLEIVRYALAIVHLERKLRKQRNMLSAIASGIERAKSQAKHFDSPTHDNVIANLADIYAQTVSNLPPRIIVQGEHGHLTNPANANKVRALLLAAMRSAVLWRQKGGNRLQFLFGRSKMTRSAQALLNATA